MLQRSLCICTGCSSEALAASLRWTRDTAWRSSNDMNLWRACTGAAEVHMRQKRPSRPAQ